MRTMLVVVASFVVIGMLMSRGVVGQEQAPDPSGQAQPAAATEQKITPEQVMEALKKYGTPGSEHEALKPMAGTFDAEVTMQMDPTAPPQTSKGRTVNELIFDGRFLKSDYKGDFMGETFKGINLLGYDKLKEKYVSFWTDSMSTGFMISEGSAADGGKSITFKGDYDCPITHTKKTMKQIVKIDGDDQHTIEMYDIGPDGKEFKSMTIKYTKAKG